MATAADHSEPRIIEPGHPVADVAAPDLQPSAPEAAALAGRSTDRLASGLRRSGETGRRIAVVGIARNIGTTSTAIALARALADNGRVVLVDLAFGAPNLSAISNDPSAPGIAELVRGAASFRHIITRDRLSRIHVIAAGRTPADLNTVMTSERLAVGMNALAQTYDHVVIDAGALTQIPLERFAKLAPRAVLVAPCATEDAANAARERLAAAGFTEVTTFLDVPPLPDSTASAPSTVAA
jgi:Mrp family chromosome partitioning ATPase